MFTRFYLCLPLLTPVYICLTLFTVYSRKHVWPSTPAVTLQGHISKSIMAGFLVLGHIYPCIFTYVDPCLIIFTPVYFKFNLLYLCLPMFTRVYLICHHLVAFNYVYQCLLVLLYLCLPMCTCLYLCLHIVTNVYPCLLIFTYVYQCLRFLPLFTCLYL